MRERLAAVGGLSFPSPVRGRDARGEWVERASGGANEDGLRHRPGRAGGLGGSVGGARVHTSPTMSQRPHCPTLCPVPGPADEGRYTVHCRRTNAERGDNIRGRSRGREHTVHTAECAGRAAKVSTAVRTARSSSWLILVWSSWLKCRMRDPGMAGTRHQKCWAVCVSKITMPRPWYAAEYEASVYITSLSR